MIRRQGSVISQTSLFLRKKVVGNVSPENIFDYIYGVLYSPDYKQKYKEFLKIDFPRTPYPKNGADFKKLVELGLALRSLHLFESTKSSSLSVSYPIDGTSIVEKLSYKNNKVFINETQYFGNIPSGAWNFYFGGYQPAQKWLIDLKVGS